MSETSKFDAFVGIAEVFRTKAEEANKIVARIKAATDDPDAAANALLNASDDEKVVAWRAWNAKRQAQIDAATAEQTKNREDILAYVRTLVPENEENLDVEKEKERFRVARGESNRMYEAVKVILGGDDDAVKEFMEHFGIVEVVSLRGNAGGAGSRGATGKRKPRISEATVDGKSVADKSGKVSFTLLSQATKIDPDVLRDAAFAAAKTDDLSSLDPGTVVTFNVTKGDKTHTVTVTTLGKPTDRKSDDDSEDETPEAESAEAESAE